MEPRIEVDESAGVLIEWPDAHQSRYPFGRLRAICPCAGCRDGGNRGGTSDPGRPLSREATRLIGIDRVGNYAVSFVWEDGHRTGIYSWDFLRTHCDCFSCRKAGRQGEEG